MAELVLTDIEMQKLVATALKHRMAKAGFIFGECESEDHEVLLLPVNLDLTGFVTVSRTEDGIWTFQQSHPSVEERFYQLFEAHAQAIAKMGEPRR